MVLGSTQAPAKWSMPAQSPELVRRSAGEIWEFDAKVEAFHRIWRGLAVDVFLHVCSYNSSAGEINLSD